MVDADLTFQTDASGPATAVVLHQNGVDQRAPRIATPQEITLEPAVLDRYVGRYQLAPGVFMTISRQGARLLAEPTGQSQQEIFASGPNEFFLKATDAQIVFEATGDGKATAIVVRQNGRDLRATRVE